MLRRFRRGKALVLFACVAMVKNRDNQRHASADGIANECQ